MFCHQTGKFHIFHFTFGRFSFTSNFQLIFNILRGKLGLVHSIKVWSLQPIARRDEKIRNQVH